MVYHKGGNLNMKKYKVGVIGATGMVGQRFLTLLEKPSLV